MTYKDFRANGKVFDANETYIFLEDTQGTVHEIPRRNVTDWMREDFDSDSEFLSAVWQDVITSPDCAEYLKL
jgi:hypothetical protein